MQQPNRPTGISDGLKGRVDTLAYSIIGLICYDDVWSGIPATSDILILRGNRNRRPALISRSSINTPLNCRED
ncbi:hypothetical protein [Paenibacillus sp. sgz500958]|uniref:hypothetical protein n=1 Tax=Paenibacillus sp. sgz500958 TaxID=3242475 RepID=UPI0036D3F813